MRIYPLLATFLVAGGFLAVLLTTPSWQSAEPERADAGTPTGWLTHPSGLEFKPPAAMPSPGATHSRALVRAGDSGPWHDLLDELAAARARIAELEREVDSLRYPQETPWGAFLRSPEDDWIANPKTRRALQLLLEDEVPVQLLPGEATWIADRIERNDWLDYGTCTTHALILFIGPARIQEEVAPEVLAELKEWFPEVSWV